MALIDVKAIQDAAKKEIAEETTKVAVTKLKELYARKEKATLVLRNIDREIEQYLADVSELTVYAAAGVSIDAGK
jgi:hypothetical protein